MSNVTADSIVQQLASKSIDVALSMVIFGLLALLVFGALIVGRGMFFCCGSCSASRSEKTPRRRNLSIDLMCVLVFFICLLQIVIGWFNEGVALEYQAGVLRGFTTVVQMLLFYVHFTADAIVAVLFLYTWLTASISFDIVLAFGDKDRAQARRRKRVLILVRRVCRVTLGLIAAIICFIMAIAVVLSLLESTKVMSKETWMLAMLCSLVPPFVVAFVGLASIAVMLCVLLVISLKKSTAILKQQTTTHKQKALHDRILQQRVTARRLAVGAALFGLHALLISVGAVAYFVVGIVAFKSDWYQAPFVFIVFDLLLMRVFPSAFLVLVMLLLFSPWRLPPQFFCVFGNDSVVKQLISKPMQIGQDNTEEMFSESSTVMTSPTTPETAAPEIKTEADNTMQPISPAPSESLDEPGDSSNNV